MERFWHTLAVSPGKSSNRDNLVVAETGRMIFFRLFCAYENSTQIINCRSKKITGPEKVKPIFKNMNTINIL